MPKLQFERPINISAPPEKVFDVVSDLGKWRAWNPWLVAEPEATVDVSQGGKAYHWKGNRIGEGRMTVVHEVSPREVSIDLEFLKPFKSQSNVAFRIEAAGDGCKVIWGMDGGLPFFLFFLKKMMSTMLGMDYDRGLTMLKDYVELGEVPSKLEWKGVADYAGCTYVGISTECAMQDIGRRMPIDFDKLSAWAKDTGAPVSGSPFSVYHKWHFSRGTCQYTCGFPIEAAPFSAPVGMETGTLPPLRVYQIGHKGAYRHVGNAWSAGMQMSRAKEIRQSKAHPPFELYTTMRQEVPENEQEVLVSFPVK